ncbi:MAG: hypothetical protein QF475_01500 [Candidatus Undinarchaeales archaeon]|jgi:uncharacterized membrane protein|nr:hypothetical protein [Candidatus Undinarchaeales archaeon]
MVFKKFEQLRTKHQILFTLIIIFAVISIWRGVWGLSDQYLLPSKPILSLWVSLLIGIIILIGAHYSLKEIVKEIV